MERDGDAKREAGRLRLSAETLALPRRVTNEALAAAALLVGLLSMASLVAAWVMGLPG
jgi:hypothetical protein